MNEHNAIIFSVPQTLNLIDFKLGDFTNDYISFQLYSH
jgi:hypothetical protein